MTPETEALVRSATAWAAVPFVPEVTLRTAAEPFGLWGRTELDAPPFWAFPWAGGQGLARYVLDHPQTVAGRRVLDVAAGSGLVAIAAAKAGARTVTAGDIDENALAAITLNAAANGTPQVIPRNVDLATATLATAGLEGADRLEDGRAGAGRAGVGLSTGRPDAVGYGPSDENAPGPGGSGTPPGAVFATGVLRAPDVVLAADVFYQRDLAAMALRFLQAARAAGATVLAADPSRAFVPRAELTPLLTYEIPVLTVLEDTPLKTVTIYTLS